MATSLLQVRVEDSLKEDAGRVFEALGIDTSTAVRMFLKRAVMDNGIPFRMTLPKEPYRADRGLRAMQEISEASEKNGTAEMSLDEINAAMKSAVTVSFGYNDEEIVSKDIIGMDYGSLFDSTQTLVVPMEDGNTQVQVAAWYDNEHSYVQQMIRTLKYLETLKD